MFHALNITFSQDNHVQDANHDDENEAEEIDEEQILQSYSISLHLIGDKSFEEAYNELNELRKLFTAVQSRKPHKLTFPVLMNLAECCINLSKPKEAVDFLRDAIHMKPRNSNVWFKLGCLLAKTNSIYDAIPAFEEAVKHCPGVHWAALTKLCQCLFVIGLFDECIMYCLNGLEENEYYSTGHTLLHEIIKQERNIASYNPLLRNAKIMLNEELVDPSILKECHNLSKTHIANISKSVTPELTEFSPKVKLVAGLERKITFVAILKYLTTACEEAMTTNSDMIAHPLVVEIHEKEIDVEDKILLTKPSSQKALPATPQQTTRTSRLSAIALSKVSSHSPGSVASTKSKLVKYIGALKGLCDATDVSSEHSGPRRSSVSQASNTMTEDSSSSLPKLSTIDFSDELKTLIESKTPLKQFVKFYLDKGVELSVSYTWDKEDVVNFCLLFIQFRRFEEIRPFNSLDDKFNISVCSIVRVFLEATVDFLTRSEQPGMVFNGNFTSTPVVLDLTSEMDCLTLPSFICHSLKTYGSAEQRLETKIRNSLVVFRLSKISQDFELMQTASSCCRALIREFSSFHSIFLGHVFRHAKWTKEEILMEMKWTYCYEQLRSMTKLFESKNWQEICSQTSREESSDIFDFSNVDLIINSDVASYLIVYAEALLQCSKENGGDLLVFLLRSLLDALNENRQVASLCLLLSQAWLLCSNFVSRISRSSRTALIKVLISTVDSVFSHVENNFALPFNCVGLFRSLHQAFLLLDESNSQSSTMNLEFDPIEPSPVDDNENMNDSFDEDEDADFAKLPIATKYLILLHEVLSSLAGGLCRSDDCTYLELIRDLLIEFIQNPESHVDGMTKASRIFVEKQIDQCVYCQIGFSLRKIRSKLTQVSEHPSAKSPAKKDVNWKNGIKLFLYYRPKEMPAYDSFKGDSISQDFGNFLRKLLSLSPAKSLMSENDIEGYLNGSISFKNFNEKLVNLSNSEEFLNPDQKYCAEICYLLADHVVKNLEYKQAIDYYKAALGYMPKLFDAWAGMALSWQSHISEDLDECDTQAEICDPDKIQPVTRSFQLAYELEPENGKLLMEYACFAYEIYSLLRRARKSGAEHQFTVSSVVTRFVDKQEATEIDLLKFVHDLFSHANESSDIDPPSDRWFCLYMLAKTGLKLDSNIIRSTTYCTAALTLLFEHDAIFPGPKSVTSQNPPRHAVECFELFYRLHADILKYLAISIDVTDELANILCKVYCSGKRFETVATQVFADYAKQEERSVNGVERARELAQICIHAMIFCSTRFTEHFKSRYRMSSAFSNHPLVSNQKLCGLTLLGWSLPENEDIGYFNGVKFGAPLFDARKIQSSSAVMLSGFWRSPHPDFDRRGAFFTHTKTCVGLLLNFLKTCSGKPEALKLLTSAQAQLSKAPSGKAKYLRDSDRIQLAHDALENALTLISGSIPVDAPCPKPKLLEVYRLQQAVVRGGFASLIDRASALLVGCYCSSQSDNPELSPPTASDVERYCQNVINQEKQMKAKADRAERANRRMSMTNTNKKPEDSEAEKIAVDPDVCTVLTTLVETIAMLH